VYELVVLGRGTDDRRPTTDGDPSQVTGHGIGFGLLGALFVGFIGNLEGLVESVYQRGLAPLAWIKWLDIKQLMDTPPTGNWTGGFWWWWRASRVIHDRDLLGNSVEVIDEFPFFSFLLGDLHPHVLALPFVLLAVGLALSMLLGARDCGLEANEGSNSTIRRFRQFLGEVTGLGTPGIILAALLLGALGFLNTWDFPIYVGLATLAIGAGLALTVRLTRGVVARAVGAGVVLGGLGWLLYLPFYLGFQSQLGGVLPNLLFPSRFSQFSVMFGLFLVVIVFFLILLSRQASGRELRRGFLGVFPWVLLAPLALVAFFLLVFTILPQGRAFANTFLDNPAIKAAVGDRSVLQLAALIARLRLASPWTYLALAGLLGWVGGMLWAQLHRESSAETQTTATEIGAPNLPLTHSPVHPLIPDVFALLMIGLALLLAYSVEFVYLRDLFGTRMNTVFKFYYQAWVMLALAAAFGVSRLVGRKVSRALKAPALVLTILLTAASLVYPLAAIPSKAGDFRGQATLDGLAYLRQSSPADISAIEWIRANVPPDAVVVESSGGSYSSEGAERISMSTGNPTLLGWDFHERQWRGSAYDRLAVGRPEALDQIYRTTRPEELPKLLEKWGVDYVLIGSLERRKFGITDAALARFDRVLTRVYDKDGVRIYAR
jgi:YYY domain-containing protein